MSSPTRIATSLDRALAAGKLPCRHPRGHYLCESSSQAEYDYHLCVSAGRVSCNCPAGIHGRDCLHAAALRWCLGHGVPGVYALCGNCRSTRVAKVGGWCIGCARMREMVAEQEGRVA